jgi:hypothetical protein
MSIILVVLRKNILNIVYMVVGKGADIVLRGLGVDV